MWKTALKGLLVAASLTLVLGVWGAGDVLAATYSTTCPTSDDACKALAERLETLQTSNETLHTDLELLHTDLSTSGTTDVSGVVALSEDDQARLDLTWYGVWLLAGLTLVLLIAPMFVRSFRFWS
jgi:hypothetical protein